ncbi:MAG: RsmF rRNA methyltransferase first C-terminal domain-containing protein [Lachnospiraceae bacterium]|nr:RsmF rRNA methyltransferase first C-terminal domain-containing protein [Lachnospiraceae bacterium]
MASRELPAAFVEEMKQLLGAEYDAFLASYEEPRRFALRINPLKVTVDTLEEAAGFHLTPVPWVGTGCYYEQQDAPSRHPFYRAGLYYLQEPSAMTPADVLDVQPGHRVADLCAAPGGKATALGAKLKGEGLLLANDISASRARALLRNLELFGVTNAFVTNTQVDQLAAEFPGYFDRVLLDAPCSGSGMFRKDEDCIRAWYPQKEDECAALQKELILHAADLLCPGGQMLYSTCTFSVKENEEVIAHLLRERPQMKLLPIPAREGFAGGVQGMDLCVRLWPHRIGGEGHFLALLQKDGELTETGLAALRWSGPAEESRQPAEERSGGRGGKKARGRDRGKGKGRNETPAAGKEDLALLEAFAEQIGLQPACFPELRGSQRDCGLANSDTQPTLQIRQGQVYLTPERTARVKGIPFLRNGLYLGELKKNRFEPSQALALSLSREDLERTVCLDTADDRLAAFMRGESIQVQEERGNGWYLVCAGAWPVGWGKLTGQTLKNHIPAGWRES